MRPRRLSAFDRRLLDKYKTGDCLIHSTMNPTWRSIQYWIQFISASRKAKGLVAEHIADIVMRNGIPHVQSTMKDKVKRKGGWFKKNFQIKFKTDVIELVKYLALYDPKRTNIYYCPLSEQVREVFDEEEYKNRVAMINGSYYDSVWRLIKTGVDDIHIDWVDKYLKLLPTYRGWITKVLKWLFKNSESASEFTCSAGISFKAADNYLEFFNYSEDSPQDIAEKKIFEDVNYLILGRTLRQLHKFNSTAVELKEV